MRYKCKHKSSILSYLLIISNLHLLVLEKFIFTLGLTFFDDRDAQVVLSESYALLSFVLLADLAQARARILVTDPHLVSYHFY